MRVDELTNRAISSTGLTHQEILAIWHRLWQQQKRHPQITEGVEDADVEIIIRERGWVARAGNSFGIHYPEKLEDECGIGVYWVFDNTEYGTWVAVNPVSRTVICDPLRLEGAPIQIPLQDVLDSVSHGDEGLNPLMYDGNGMSFLTNKE